MTPAEQKLFVSVALGISFQLGFSSLLLAAATRRGSDAAKWLSDFEERVVQDARRMTAGEDVPEAVIGETMETIVAEFRQVFDSVREKVEGAPSRGVVEKVARHSGSGDSRAHFCAGGRCADRAPLDEPAIIR